MISRIELFMFWGVHRNEYGANEWKDRVSVGLNIVVINVRKIIKNVNKHVFYEKNKKRL